MGGNEGKLEVALFLLLGTGVLLPWNAFLTAYDLFTHLYTTFPFEFVLSLMYNVAGSGMLFASIWLAPRLGSFGRRLVAAFAVDLVALVLVPVFAIAASARVSVWLVLLLAAATGAATAISFGASMGLASFFGPASITAVMTGNGISGLVTAVLKIVVKVSLPSDDRGYRIGAGIYFGIAGVVALACIVGSAYLVRLPSATRLIAERKSNAAGESAPLVAAEIEDGDTNATSSAEKIPVATAAAAEAPKKEGVGAVFRKIWLQASTVWLVFFVTLSLFPGVITLITPHPPSSESSTSAPSSWLDEWFQIINISCFMVGDFIGRMAPSIRTAFSPKSLWIPTAVRLLFFPALALLAANVWTGGAAYWTPILVMIFALTNGYFSTLAMMYGSKEGQGSETASTIMSFSLNFGIFCASIFAIFMLYFINGRFSL